MTRTAGRTRDPPGAYNARCQKVQMIPVIRPATARPILFRSLGCRKPRQPISSPMMSTNRTSSMALIAPIPVGAWPARLRISLATPATANGMPKARAYQPMGCRHAVIRSRSSSERALAPCDDDRRECRSEQREQPEDEGYRQEERQDPADGVCDHDVRRDRVAGDRGRERRAGGGGHQGVPPRVDAARGGRLGTPAYATGASLLDRQGQQRGPAGSGLLTSPVVTGEGVTSGGWRHGSPARPSTSQEGRLA